MKSTAIVTMSDANYFNLLMELIDSILRFNESKDISICVLDVGLKDQQINILNKKVYKILKVKWDIEVPSFKVLGNEALKSQISGAFLPKHFPGFNKYLWIDADAWVNSWEAIDLYIKGSDNNKLAVSTSADRSSGRVLRADWFFRNYAKIKSQNYKHAKSSGFSETIARTIGLMPHLNLGVFCLNQHAPHWEVWQKNLKKALKHGKIYGSGQVAMNIAIYYNNLPAEFLPTYCNWIYMDNIKFDLKKNTFVEPYLPNHEIGIMHLAGKNMNYVRFNKEYLSEISTLDGQKIKKSLRFRNFD